MGNKKVTAKTAKENKGASKFTKVIIACLSVALVAVGVVVIVLLLRETPEPVIEQSEPNRGVARGMVATEENLEEVLDMILTPSPDPHFTTSMTVDWVFDRWDAPGQNIMVENASVNTRTVYFDLFLNETDELIYSSPFIPVGERLDQFTLDAQLPAGNHPATVVYHLVDDDFNDLTSVSLAVMLRVLN